MIYVPTLQRKCCCAIMKIFWVVFSYELTFHLSGYVNTLNVRIWLSENPHETVQLQRDSPKLSVFCVISRRKVYGSFFFGEATVTGTSYIDALQLYLLPQLKENKPNNLIWQQDGAPSHWHHEVRDWLNVTVPNRYHLDERCVILFVISCAIKIDFSKYDKNYSFPPLLKIMEESSDKYAPYATNPTHEENDNSSSASVILGEIESRCQGFRRERRGTMSLKKSFSDLNDMGQVDEISSEKSFSEVENGEIKQINLKDRGYSWVIVILLVVINSLFYGYMIGFPIIYSALLDSFPDEDPAILGMIISYLLGISGVISPAASALEAVLGERAAVMTGAILVFLGIYLASFCTTAAQLILTLGCMVGIGQALGDMPQITIIRNYFDKKQGIATAFRMSGISIGGFIFPPINVFLIETFGLRYALVIISCIIAQSCVLSALLRPFPIHERIIMKDHCKGIKKNQLNAFTTNQGQAKEKKPLDYALLCNIRFLLLLFANLARSTAVPVAIFYLPLLGKSVGLTNYESSVLLTYVVGSDSFIKIIIGLVLDKNWFTKNNHMIFAFLVGAVGVILMPFLTTLWQLIMASTLLSFCVANFIVTYTVVLAEEFEESSSSAWAFSRLAFGSSNLVSPTVVGIIVKITGNYKWPFVFMGSGLVMAAILLIISVFIERRKKRSEDITVE